MLNGFIKHSLCIEFCGGNTPVTHLVHDPTRIISTYSIEDVFNLFKELHNHILYIEVFEGQGASRS